MQKPGRNASVSSLIHCTAIEFSSWASRCDEHGEAEEVLMFKSVCVSLPVAVTTV